jgi:hypothetical protein
MICVASRVVPFAKRASVVNLVNSTWETIELVKFRIDLPKGETQSARLM